MKIDDHTAKCPVCELVAPFSSFYVRNNGGYKCYGICKKCAIERATKWNKDNPQKRQKTLKKYRDNNPEKMLESHRKYRRNNRDKRRKWNKQQYWKNISHSRNIGIINAEKRRASKSMNGGILTLDDLNTIYDSFRDSSGNVLCAYCGDNIPKPLMDHIVPVFGGGPHSKENIVPACQSCNQTKGVDYIDFFDEPPQNSICWVL